MMLSSRTLPQLVQTASPLALSVSISDEPQFLHFMFLDDIFMGESKETEEIALKYDRLKESLKGFLKVPVENTYKT